VRKRIESIKIKRDIDEYPDTSWLGEYSNKRARFSFDRKVLGDMGRNEYRYFNPYPNPFDGKTQAEKRDYAKLAKLNYKRMESLNTGNYQFLFIRAEAEVIINGVIQTISSCGSGGIESDSGEDYLKEIEKEELINLTEILKELGFKESQISKIEVQEDN
jgi:hypothetical protein